MLTPFPYLHFLYCLLWFQIKCSKLKHLQCINHNKRCVLNLNDLKIIEVIFNLYLPLLPQSLTFQHFIHNTLIKIILRWYRKDTLTYVYLNNWFIYMRVFHLETILSETLSHLISIIDIYKSVIEIYISQGVLSVPPYNSFPTLNKKSNFL